MWRDISKQVQVILQNNDSFGNLRNTQGNDLGLTGGDFRFQGQWLESTTDLYHFRARYYDPESGRFISRDPVEIIEYEPESSNPYQFVYNNPHIYSDPSGEFTISEINAGQAIQDALASVRRYAGAQAKDYVLQRLGDSFGNVVLSTLNAFIPGSSVLNDLLSGINNSNFNFDHALRGTVCNYFDGIPLKDNLFFEVKIDNHGKPLDNGLNCSDHDSPSSTVGLSRSDRRLLNQIERIEGSRPDFMFRNSLPKAYRSKDNGAYILGDIKFYLGAARNAILNLDPDNQRTHRQWERMTQYAKRYQMLPFVSYLSLFDGNPLERNSSLSRSVSKTDRKRIQAEAISKGVIVVLANLIDN